MVSVPQNPFSAGDGASSANSANPAFTPQSINNAAESTGIAAAALYAGSPAVPAAYPVGFSGFYCMKYEISQQQYVDFLNSLSYDQQVNHTAIAPNTAAPTTSLNSYAMITGGTVGSAPNPTRNGIRINAPGDATLVPKQPAVYMCDLNGNATADMSAASQDGLNIAANYLSWVDIAAYLDWAALRPMSEMEYEKISRGTNAAVAKEYAWGLGLNFLTTANSGCGPAVFGYRDNGASNICIGGSVEYGNTYPSISMATTNNITNSGLNSETTSLTGATALETTPGGAVTTYLYVGKAVVGGTGPFRVGAMAGSAAATNTRISSGAGFYGILDLSGNVLERTISTAAAGLTFRGDSLGNGNLDANGYHDVGFWPAYTTAAGTGFRGGSFATTTTENYSAVAGTVAVGVFYATTGGNATQLQATVRGTDMKGYVRLRVSDRNDAYQGTGANAATRVSDYGGRGVR